MENRKVGITMMLCSLAGHHYIATWTITDEGTMLEMQDAKLCQRCGELVVED